MPLPSSGLITLAQIYAEFGIPAGAALESLVKGGQYIPATVAANIPTTPPVKLSDFYGAFRPPSIAILNAQATVTGDGTLTGSFTNELVATFGVNHVDTYAANPAASTTAVCTLTVPIKVLVATTPTMQLTVGQFNPTGGGFQYPNIAMAPSAYPPFDNLTTLANANGPGAEDTDDSYQGSWSIALNTIGGGIGDGANERVTDSVELGPVSDNDIVALTFTLTHTFSAFIGNQSNFGQTLTFNLGPGVTTTFRLAMLFLDGSGNIVQEVPFDIIINHTGRLRATCVEFG